MARKMFTQEQVRVMAENPYGPLCQQYSREDVDELVELITETLCAARPTIRVGGENMPAEQVKARFLTLNSEHIGYVLDSMARNSADIRNIRAYLLTVAVNCTQDYRQQENWRPRLADRSKSKDVPKKWTKQVKKEKGYRTRVCSKGRAV